MPQASKNISNLATELAILESLIKEQNKNTDQYTIPFDAVGHIRDFVKAVEAVLILFDLENRDWANKKMLREGEIWTSGSALFDSTAVLLAPRR